MKRSPISSMGPAFLIFALAACGGGGGGGGGGGSGGGGTAPPPAPTVTLTSDATSVASGLPVTLTWSSANATSCTASGGWKGNLAVSGVQVSPTILASTTFTLSCTGPGGSTSGSVKVEAANSGDATVVSSTYAVPTANAPSVVDGDTTVTAPTPGAAMVVQHIESTNKGDIAHTSGVILDARFEGDDFIRILSGAATAEATHIVIDAASQFAGLAADQRPVVYVYVSPDEDDGGEHFAPIKTIFDPASGSVTIDLPSWAYFDDETLGMAAMFKIGVATLVDVPASPVIAKLSSAAEASPYVPDTPLLRCPLAECIESSMFNPMRKLKPKQKKDAPPPGPALPNAHHGMDLRIPADRPVYAPPGGHIVMDGGPDSNRSSQFMCTNQVHQNQLDQGRDEKSTCGRYGINVVLWFPDLNVRIRYAHLNKIEDALIDPVDKTQFDETFVSDGKAIAMSGATGVAVGSPHLHFELFMPSSLACTAASCGTVWSPRDPFPHMVKQFVLRGPVPPPPNKPTLDDGTPVSLLAIPFLATPAPEIMSIEALGVDNAIVRSDVGDAHEFDSPSKLRTAKNTDWYDPTRKLCLSTAEPIPALQFAATQVPTVSGVTYPRSIPNKGFCAPWGSTFTVQAVPGFVEHGLIARFSVDPLVLLDDDPLSRPSNRLQLMDAAVPTVAIQFQAPPDYVHGGGPSYQNGIWGHITFGSQGPVCIEYDYDVTNTVYRPNGTVQDVFYHVGKGAVCPGALGYFFQREDGAYWRTLLNGGIGPGGLMVYQGRYALALPVNHPLYQPASVTFTCEVDDDSWHCSGAPAPPPE